MHHTHPCRILGWAGDVVGPPQWHSITNVPLPVTAPDEPGSAGKQQSEERFRLLVEGVRDYAIFMLDPTGHIISWNTGAEKIKGYTADDIIGKHFSIFYPQQQIDRGFPQYELEVAAREGRFEDEGWRIRKDGSRFWANVVITSLFDESGELRGYAKVTRDMTERKRVEALELAERQMLEFLAMLSHELRNPLAPISNAVYMLHLKELDDPELVWMRDVIERQVMQLTRLVDDLLEVSRVTSGHIRLQRERIDLASVVSRAVESSRPLMNAHHQTLDIKLPDTPAIVDGDSTRLAQVVVNLLNNAAKYTQEGGHIDVALHVDGESAVVCVRDNGVGITAELMPRIFDLFTQGERTLDRSEGGLGIGLTLVRRLVEMHGGTIEVASGGTGKGTEFLVRLPMTASDGVEDHQTPAQPKDVASANASMRVLIVDDNIDAATSMMHFIRKWGYDVRTAHDGYSAVEAARVFRPDVVLLDIGLPGLDGFEVASRLRSMPETSGAQLVAVTGYGQEDDRRRTQNAGFVHHFVKPLDPLDLREFLTGVRIDRNGSA